MQKSIWQNLTPIYDKNSLNNKNRHENLHLDKEQETHKLSELDQTLNKKTIILKVDWPIHN